MSTFNTPAHPDQGDDHESQLGFEIPRPGDDIQRQYHVAGGMLSRVTLPLPLPPQQPSSTTAAGDKTVERSLSQKVEACSRLSLLTVQGNTMPDRGYEPASNVLIWYVFISVILFHRGDKGDAVNVKDLYVGAGLFELEYRIQVEFIFQVRSVWM